MLWLATTAFLSAETTVWSLRRRSSVSGESLACANSCLHRSTYRPRAGKYGTAHGLLHLHDRGSLRPDRASAGAGRRPDLRAYYGPSLPQRDPPSFPIPVAGCRRLPRVRHEPWTGAARGRIGVRLYGDQYQLRP